jgi:hypothetical protein
MANLSKSGNSLRSDTPSRITVIYCLFTLLYTVYITNNTKSFGPDKWNIWGYFLKFLLIGSYCFFILQGLIQKSKNWGMLVLLPAGILIATILAGYMLVWIIRLGGGDLLNHDKADMITAALIFLTLTYLAGSLIGTGKKSRRR